MLINFPRVKKDNIYILLNLINHKYMKKSIK
jgi:hypothetical protein